MLRMWEPGKRLKLIGIIVCIGVLLMMLSGGLVLWLGSRDIDPPDVSDLELEVIEVAAEDNAFTHLKRAVAAMKWKDTSYLTDPEAADLRSWMKGDVELSPELLAETMEENQGVVDGWLCAAGCDYFVPPQITPAAP